MEGIVKPRAQRAVVPRNRRRRRRELVHVQNDAAEQQRPARLKRLYLKKANAEAAVVKHALRQHGERRNKETRGNLSHRVEKDSLKTRINNPKK